MFSAVRIVTLLICWRPFFFRPSRHHDAFSVGSLAQLSCFSRFLTALVTDVTVF